MRYISVPLFAAFGHYKFVAVNGSAAFVFAYCSFVHDLVKKSSGCCFAGDSDLWFGHRLRFLSYLKYENLENLQSSQEKQLVMVLSRNVRNEANL